MAFLAPLAAGAGTAATAGAATTALGAGLSAGTILGTGAASSGVLGGLGLNALGGMASTLPASASLMAAAPTALGAGASTLVPAAGIFAKAAPALGGLKSIAAPGLLNTMGMSPLAGLAGTTSMVPTATGLSALAPAVTTSPAAGGLLNTLGMSPLGGAQAIIPNATVAGQTAALEAAKGSIIGSGAQAQTNLARQLAMDAAKQQAVGGGTQSLVNTATANANLANTNANIVNAINQNVAGGAAQASPGIASAPAPYTPASPIIKGQNFLQNAGNFFKDPSVDAAIDYAKEHPMATAAGAYGAYQMLKPDEKKPSEKSPGLIRPYEFSRTQRPEAYAVSPTKDSSERTYFTETFTPLTPYEAPGPEYRKAAEGGLMGLAVGGPVEQMAALNAVGANTGYPQAGINTPLYSNPMMQRPEAVNVISPSGDAGVSAYSGEPKFASGGLSDLGGYSDGGRLLKGPGDGVSDSIPAVIGQRQPARLADGEFVVPARIVSELGNGSTEAGARKLYAMMDRVQKARSKTVGKKKVAVNTRADKHLPA